MTTNLSPLLLTFAILIRQMFFLFLFGAAMVGVFYAAKIACLLVVVIHYVLTHPLSIL